MVVYNYDGDTREYLASSVEFLPVGVAFLLIPAPMRHSMRKMVLLCVARPVWMSGSMLQTIGAKQFTTLQQASLSNITMPGDDADGTSSHQQRRMTTGMVANG